MPAKYRSYLLRLWPEGSGIRPSWRFTLTSLGDDRQHGFAALDKLVDYVQAQMAEIAASDASIKDATTKE